MGLGARVDVVESMKKAAAKPNIRVLTDGKTSYGTLFTDIDRMFSLNHTCA